MAVERKWAEFTASPHPLTGNGPYASLNSRGLIVLNRRAFEALGEPEAVVFLFDIDNLSIGLKPCDLLMPNAFAINQRGSTGTHIILAMPFTRAHQIFTTGTIRFLKPEIEKGVLVLDLNHTARVTQGSRKGWRKKC